MTKIGHNPPVQRMIWLVIKLYMHAFHRLEVRGSSSLPERPPFLALASHFSFLDVPALIAADPYHPDVTLVVKESVMHVPVISAALRAWGAVPVARDGHDLAALRSILHVLERGWGICVAAEGTRSRTGHLGSMHPVLMRVALDVASKGIPVIPTVVNGTFEAMPSGALFPRPRKIRVLFGDPIDFSPWLGKRVDRAKLSEVAALIQSKLAELLPPERRPAPGTPALGSGRLEPKSRGERSVP